MARTFSPYRLAVGRPTSGRVLYGGHAGLKGEQPPNMVNLPAELYPPENSTPIFLSDSVALAGAGSSARPAGLMFIVPPNMIGVIDGLELMVDGLLISTVIQFTAMVSGSPVQGFNNLSILGRNGVQSVSKSLGPFLRLLIPPGGSFQMQMLDVDGGAVTMGAQARGWFWPVARSA